MLLGFPGASSRRTSAKCKGTQLALTIECSAFSTKNRHVPEISESSPCGILKSPKAKVSAKPMRGLWGRIERLFFRDATQWPKEGVSDLERYRMG